MSEAEATEAKAKTYVCRSCEETKKLGTNFKFVTSWFSKKFQDWDSRETWDKTLCAPCGIEQHSVE